MATDGLTRPSIERQDHADLFGKRSVMSLHAKGGPVK